LLVTAADEVVARTIAAHLGLFDGVFASDGVLNLKGAAKAQFLTERFGPQGFDYVGDAVADIPVWREAAQAYVVAPDAALLRRARIASAGAQPLGTAPSTITRVRHWARALRVHQWAKNVLIFLPVFAGHRFDNLTLFRSAAFTAFSLCASSVYLLNDLLDLPHDRLHATKRRRPFASGALNIAQAPPLMLACLAAAVAFSLWLPPRFILMLGVYYVCTLTYSLGLKRLAVWDVMMLAGLYTLRVFVGSAATANPISPCSCSSASPS
jgi:hypothetical protein